MTDLVRLSCLLLLDLGFKDSWTYNFKFLYNLSLIQYFTKRNNFMVSRIWTFMTLVLFILLIWYFSARRWFYALKSKYREMIFIIALVFTFIIAIKCCSKSKTNLRAGSAQTMRKRRQEEKEKPEGATSSNCRGIKMRAATETEKLYNWLNKYKKHSVIFIFKNKNRNKFFGEKIGDHSRNGKRVILVFKNNPFIKAKKMYCIYITWIYQTLHYNICLIFVV